MGLELMATKVEKLAFLKKRLKWMLATKFSVEKKYFIKQEK